MPKNPADHHLWKYRYFTQAEQQVEETKNKEKKKWEYVQWEEASVPVSQSEEYGVMHMLTWGEQKLRYVVRNVLTNIGSV